MARLPRKVREINDFNATDWFEKLLQRTTLRNAAPGRGGISAVQADLGDPSRHGKHSKI